MRTKRTVITALLIAALNITTTQGTFADDPPPKQDTWLALCLVATMAVAAGAIYVVAKKCKPKYYCLKDDEQPPNYWTGTATRKECAINGWTQVSGPYDTPGAVVDCPPKPGTNVTHAALSPLKIRVQSSQDLVSWTTVYTEVCDLDDFGYATTNAGFFRLEVSAP